MATDDDKREENNEFTPIALKLVGLGVICLLLTGVIVDSGVGLPFVLVGAVSLLVGGGYLLFKLFLRGVFETFKAAKKGTAAGSGQRSKKSDT